MQEQDRQQMQSVLWRLSGLDRSGSAASLKRCGRDLCTFREPCQVSSGGTGGVVSLRKPGRGISCGMCQSCGLKL